jgi:hypothetical protein
MKKFLTIFAFVLVTAGGFYIWWNYFFVFGEGVKTGYLNYVVRKGNVFKTWEGKLIQTGIRTKSAGSIQSYEFDFSVINDSLAMLMQKNSGKLLDLHYREYHGSLPWRGYTSFIVDKVVGIRDPD